MTTVHAGPASSAGAPAWHALPIVDAARELDVDARVGLTTEDALGRRADVGPNALTVHDREPGQHAFARHYDDVLQLVLVAAALVSFALGDSTTGVIVLAVTAVNAVLGLVRDGEPARTAAVLQRLLVGETRVRRDGVLQDIAVEQLVPGDVVLIAAGDVVPADGRLLKSATLEVDESALTGEGVPVAKGIDLVDDATAPLGDRTDMVYATTRVTRGTSEFVVTAIGMSTEVGRIAALLRAREATPTPLAVGLTRLKSTSIPVVGAALLVCAVADVARGQTLESVLTAAVAFALAATPVALPAAITALLAHGSHVLARDGILVKQLRAVELVGALSAIAVNKSGTLTLGQMTAVELVAAQHRHTISGTGYSPEGTILRVGGEPAVPFDALLVPLALASDAVLVDGEVTGDPSEAALVVLAEKGGLSVAGTREAYPRVAELPFDAAHQLMATFHRTTDELGAEVVRCFVRGAPDALLSRSVMILGPDLRPLAVLGEVRQQFLTEAARLARQGLRVVATARRDIPSADFDLDDELLPLVDRLTLLSLVGVIDPPRMEAQPSIAAAQAAGIQIQLITSDRAVTADVIAHVLGIEGRTVTGAGLAALSDAQAREALDEIGVVASATPQHEVRLVELLKAKGHVVAVSGSGINDAPALQAADIGIAMGAAGTEASRAAATIVLAGGDVSTIVRAVEYGRGLFDDVLASIRFQLGVLAGMIATFVGASVLGIAAGMPFLALQALYVGFAILLAPAIALGCRTVTVDGLLCRDPRPVDEPLVSRREAPGVIAVGLVQAVVTLAVIALAERAWETETARTMGLVTFSLTIVLWASAARDERQSVFRLQTVTDRTAIVAAALSLLAIALAAQTTAFQDVLGTEGLDVGQWLLCLVAALPILVATELRVGLRRR